MQSLHKQSESLVCVASSKSDLFPDTVGLGQDCPLSQILFITFMDRISWHSQGAEGLQIGDLMMISLLSADYVVLLVF